MHSTIEAALNSPSTEALEKTTALYFTNSYATKGWVCNKFTIMSITSNISIALTADTISVGKSSSCRLKKLSSSLTREEEFIRPWATWLTWNLRICQGVGSIRGMQAYCRFTLMCIRIHPVHSYLKSCDFVINLNWL